MIKFVVYKPKKYFNHSADGIIKSIAGPAQSCMVTPVKEVSGPLNLDKIGRSMHVQFATVVCSEIG